MLNKEPMVIESVKPLQGSEGTIVTLKGSGFPTHIRNNCVVVGGMGACARVQPNPKSTEMKVRIGPVAKEKTGDILAWPGTGLDLYTEKISSRKSSLSFSETSIFRNGAPVASAGVQFKLLKASPNTYAAYVEQSANSRVDLAGLENGPVLQISFPKDLSFSRRTTVDVCVVLKEPTLAIDFSAAISGSGEDPGESLLAIAKSITVNALLVGEKVSAGVSRDEKTGELQLLITKPYLTNGMASLRFSSGRSS